MTRYKKTSLKEWISVCFIGIPIALLFTYMFYYTFFWGIGTLAEFIGCRSGNMNPWNPLDPGKILFVPPECRK